MLGFFIAGVLTSDVFRRYGRTSRVGLAIGLLMHYPGYLIAGALVSFSDNSENRKITRKDWLVWGLVVLIALGLVWAVERVWDWNSFNPFLLWCVIVVGLLGTVLSARLDRSPYGDLPTSFWLMTGLGAGVAMTIQGTGETARGAWIGAWLWLIGTSLLAYARNRRAVQEEL